MFRFGHAKALVRSVSHRSAVPRCAISQTAASAVSATAVTARTFSSSSGFVSSPDVRPYTGLAELTSSPVSLRAFVGADSQSAPADSQSQSMAQLSEAEIARLSALSYLAPPDSPAALAAAQASLSGLVSWLARLPELEQRCTVPVPVTGAATVTGGQSQSGLPTADSAAAAQLEHPLSPLPLLARSLGLSMALAAPAAPALPLTILATPTVTAHCASALASASTSASASASGSAGDAEAVEGVRAAPGSLLRLRADIVGEGAGLGSSATAAAAESSSAAAAAAAAAATAAARALVGMGAHSDRGYYTVPAADADEE